MNGNLQELFRSKDWSTTKLGGAQTWAPSLKSALTVILSSPFPMSLWWGSDLTWLYNDAYAAMLGHRHPDALGLPAKTAWPELWNRVGSEVQSALVTGRPVQIPRLGFVLKRGKHAEEAYLTFSYVPAPDEEGGIAGLYCSCYEETQQVLDERRLEILQQLANATLDGKSTEDVCRVAARTLAKHHSDVLFAIFYLSEPGARARLGGLVGVSPGSTLAPERIDLASDRYREWPFWEALSSRSVVTIQREPQVLAAADTLALPSPNIMVLPLTSGRCIGWLILGASPRLEFDEAYQRFFRSIARIMATATSVAESRAKALSTEGPADMTATPDATAQKDDFLANLAHELRNPLEAILNATDILKAKSPPNRELQGSQDIISRQTKRMGRLLDDLIDVARLTHDKLELRRERVELASLVQTALESSRSLIRRRRQHLIIDTPPHAIYLDADPTRMVQVFENLIDNASNFTQSEGQISVTAKVNPPPLSAGAGTVEVSIKDNGRGIPAEFLPKVFERFAQEDRSMERPQGGLGLGLTLAKRLVEMHGGSVEAHSEGRGVGSEFVVRLPVLTVAVAESEPVRKQAPVAVANRRSRRVLVVEDNVDAAQSLSILLQMRGNDVVTALDGVEAVEAAAAFQPDLILLDIGLPKLNGYEAAQRIRQERGNDSLVIVALTGWGQEEDRRQSREAGINQHMVKPVDPAILDELLASTPILE